jgi:hypothetical protein
MEERRQQINLKKIEDDIQGKYLRKDVVAFNEVETKKREEENRKLKEH